MVEVVVVYWRDIPAQVIVGKGRSGAKRKLTERFEQAIDRCAMKIGAKDADAYLADPKAATDLWVNFKVFGIMPLTFIFTLFQLPLITRTTIPEEKAQPIR